MSSEFDRGWEFQDEERPEAEEPSSTEMGPPDEASENVDDASWDDEGRESGEDSPLGDEPSWREQVPTAPPTAAQAEGPNGTRAATGQFSGNGVKERVASNALDLARHGTPRPPFYMTGQVAGQPFSVHAEGERVFLTRPGQPRQEIELVGPPPADKVMAAAPPQSPESLPEPLCPQGVPEGETSCSEPSPGVSWFETAPPLAGVDEAQSADPSVLDRSPMDQRKPQADEATGGAP